MTASTLIERFFTELLELPAAQRAAQLAELGASHPTLQAELESLLAAAEQAQGFLSRPLLPQGWADADCASSLLGQRVGPYRLMRELGQGGMGTVYLAERADGHYRQQVAIKLIRPGVDSEIVSKRFCAERQILAQLTHPHITRLLDGGKHADGRPYLVMEYIQGEPIDRYCHKQALSLHERLKLFAQVCAAMAYAHQQGVIHRDLKPSNILVTAEGQPKLLDFGIAKLLEPTLSEERSLTITGCSPLTPDFAAPEQLRNEVITPATDIYALGLLLFELLTGQRPYESSVDRAVLDTRPPLPSRVAPAALRPKLRGDLDNIVRRTLAYRPEHRYGSARQLAQDVECHLNQQPVKASGSVKRRYFNPALGGVLMLVLLATILTQVSATVAREPCDGLLTQYRSGTTDTAFVQWAQCQLDRARAFNSAEDYSAALTVLNKLRTVYRNHPGKRRPAPYAQAGYILEEFARAAYGNGDFEQALQYRQQQLKRIKRRSRRGGAT